MRKLIVLSSREYVRNYLSINAFSSIEDDNCYYIALEDIKPNESIEKKERFLGYVTVSHKAKQKYMRIFDILMWRYRSRSTAFYFRF